VAKEVKDVHLEVEYVKGVNEGRERTEERRGARETLAVKKEFYK
jgi:hypothetical protein